jgi:hypothetical protein
MGTRADFYIKRAGEALISTDWVGSIAWGGYPQGIADRILNATDASEFRMAIDEAAEDDFTSADKGWPWPWTNSCMTNYSYVFWVEESRVIHYRYGVRFNPEDDKAELFDQEHDLDFPEMDSSTVAPDGSPASGIIIGQAHEWRWQRRTPWECYWHCEDSAGRMFGAVYGALLQDGKTSFKPILYVFGQGHEEPTFSTLEEAKTYLEGLIK